MGQGPEAAASGELSPRDEIQVGRLLPDLEESFLDFYRSTLKEAVRFEKYWPWHKAGPQGIGTEEAFVATFQGRLVGGVGAVAAPVTYAGRRIHASWQQDSIVSPSLRGKGVGRKLVEAAAQDFDVVMAKGTSDAMYRLRKSAGFQDVPRSNYLLKVLKPARHVNLGKRWLAEIVLRLWGKMLEGLAARGRVPVTTVDRFDESVDGLASALSVEPVFRLYKSTQYLNWRYLGCPDRKYNILRAGAADSRGWAVTGIAEGGRGDGWIIDLLCPTNDRACRHSLLCAGVRNLRSSGVTRILAFATLPQARRSLMRLGFVPVPSTPRFTFRQSSNIPLPVPMENFLWDFWHGDGDVELYQ
jgi:GNAT superfamily N-acetyltransferase